MVSITQLVRVLNCGFKSCGFKSHYSPILFFMLLKKFKPVTSTLRHLKYYRYENYWLKKFVKDKVSFLKKKNGRNNSGSITVYGKSRGHKKLYRHIDFRRLNLEGVVVGIEYDPFRTANIARVFDYKTKKHFYILAPKNLLVGSLVKSGENIKARLGNALPLKSMPIGSIIHNLTLERGGKGKLVRSAGSFAQVLQRGEKFARVRIKSGEVRLASVENIATVGSVSNEKLFLNKKGKAGRSRWLGIRPKVRGVAMNPVDHPHGGGEGRTSGGRASVSAWGKPAKAKGSTTSRSRNKLVILSRKKK